MKFIMGIAVFAVLGGVMVYGAYSERTVSIEKEAGVHTEQEDAGDAFTQAFVRDPLTGRMCASGGKRPFAVMLAGDTVARPLSGIAQADVVVEMPVLTNGITRFMAVFSCAEPEEIGSIRSARDDFLPFAKSFDAIYAHWGGSHFALDLLNAGVLNNIDALRDPFNAFYRKEDRIAPHNGFTSIIRLRETAEKRGYRIERKGNGYPHIPDNPLLSIDQTVMIGYPGPYGVEFLYDHTTNSYFRSRGGKKEMDSGTEKQVEVKNVIVMIAETKQLDADYNTVVVEGEGRVRIFRNGEEKKGTWKRVKEEYAPERSDHSDNKYYYVDEQGKEIGLVEGKIWIALVQPDQKVELKFH
ncbi:hypothetical protein A2Z10_02140 [Candidatus Azambacteria bacterium RBG_16_47_10]|uniref:DUF3048 domain-containing protein n=1 Tax=Candidatus Azambacteria bacterium RBG_16_47_10 TaxID=1797292 RepID=A0A1F5AYC0_9BACT|nr:MAG: hypothetical protein A2Z10_02140 [Candidatus Azambacteria bacterium RBG_16_47_10]